MPNFMKIRPVKAQLFPDDGEKGSHDEANSRLSQYCERVYSRTATPCSTVPWPTQVNSSKNVFMKIRK